MVMMFGPKQAGQKYGQPVVPNLNVRHICPNCHSDPPNIIEEASKGDLVCGDCGTILGDRIVDTRSEWRTFAGDENGADPSRVGDAGNPLLGSNLDTVISGRDGHSGLSQSLQRAQNRSNATNLNGRTSAANLSAAFARIAEKCDFMQLGSNITVRAQHVYKIADERKIVKGKNDNLVIAACIIFACRDAGSQRSFAEVGKALGVVKKDLGALFIQIKAAVGQERVAQGFVNGHTGGQSSTANIVEDLLRRYCNFLDLGNTILNAARHIGAEAVIKTDVDSRGPSSIASGVLWLTCTLFGQPLSIKELSSHAGVTDSTIKLVCKRVAVKLDEVIRSEWRTQFPDGYANLVSMARVNEVGISRGGTPRPEARGGSPKPSLAAPAGNGSGNGAANGTRADAIEKK